MRILHVVRQYSPGIGGLETYVAMLAREQRRRGHDVGVLTLDRIFGGDGARLPAEQIVDGIPVRRVAWHGSRRYPLAPAMAGRLGGADIVHVHGVDSIVDVLAATQAFHRKPLILSTHGGFFHTGFARRLKSLYFATVTRWSLAGVRAVLASSVQDHDRFAALWPDRTFLVENGVDTDRFGGLARTGARIIIAFGRIAPNKEVPRLLRWFAALVAAEPDWRLIVAGRPMGMTMAMLREDAETLGIAAATEFHEAPDDPALGTLIARSGAFACASSYEGFGLAAVEAVAAGLYPILSDIAPFRRTVERVGLGTLVDFRTDDIAAFQADWRRYVASPPGPAAIASSVAPYAWPLVAARIEAVMLAVLGRHRRRIGPLDIAVRTRDEALAEVLGAIAVRRPLLVAFANAHTVNVARADPAFAATLDGALVLNDGIGVDLASRSLYGRGFPANLNGTDFTPALLAALPGSTRLFLIGSRPGTVEEAGRRLMAAYPNVVVVGSHHGFFSAGEEAALVDRIARLGVDLVLAGMGNPRQERWAHAHLERLAVPILCVGALFDFTAGAVRRAPQWVRRTRTEWLYRLAREPRRMARRYLVGNGAFLAGVMRQWASGRRGGPPQR